MTIDSEGRPILTDAEFIHRFIFNGEKMFDPDNPHRNARLIAAAPELLDLVKLAMDRWKPDDLSQCAEFMRRANALVTTIEGRV